MQSVEICYLYNAKSRKPMNGQRILVVDDEQDICDILQFNLEREGYLVDTASSAEEALEKLGESHALILLDVMMGGMSGFKMAEKLRQEKNAVPIIFLTAKNAETDMLTGFSLGGDDYISKPFSVKEVLARVKAILKRRQPSEQASKSDVLTFGNLIIEKNKGRAKLDDTELVLTKKEFEILRLLAEVSPNVMTRSEILNAVWSDNEYVLDRTVDVHITRLRKKLGKYAPMLANRSGFGYYLNMEWDT